MLRGISWLVPILFVVAGGSNLFAHDLGAEVKIRADVVEVHAYYDDGTVARNAKVMMRDSEEKLIADGRTDKQGVFTCPRPQPGQYVLEVNAGAGHLTKLKFTVRQTATATKEEKNASAAADLPYEIVSDTPSKGEFTNFPWLKAGLGVTIIGLLCLALLIAVMVRRQQKP